MSSSERRLCDCCNKMLTERTIRAHHAALMEKKYPKKRKVSKPLSPQRPATPIQVDEEPLLEEIPAMEVDAGELLPQEILPTYDMEVDEAIDFYQEHNLPTAESPDLGFQSEGGLDEPQDVPQFPENESMPLHHQEYLDMYQEGEEQVNELEISDAREQGEELYDYVMEHHQISTALTEDAIRVVETQNRMLEEVRLQLTEDDIRDFKSYVLRSRFGFSSNQAEMMRAAYQKELHLASETVINRKVQNLSNLKTYDYDACKNSCGAFAGEWEELEECPECKAPRRVNGRRQNSWNPISMVPQLQSYMQDRATNKQMAEYREKLADLREQYPDRLFDQRDGILFQELRKRNIRVGDKILDVKYGQDSRDIFFSVSMDGFTFYETIGQRAKKNKYNVWLIIATIHAFDPRIRTHRNHVMVLGAIPGPGHPKNLNTYLVWFRDECHQLALGIATWDALRQEVYLMRAYPIIFFGDFPAISAVMLYKGHTGMTPCRTCYISGQLLGTHYYPAHRRPDELLSASNNPEPQDLDINELLQNPRTHETYLEDLRVIDGAPNKTQRELLMKQKGISGRSILAEIDSIDFGRSFPHGIMHMILLNNTANLVALWTGSFRDVKLDNASFVLSSQTWKDIAKNVDAAMDLIPSCFTRRLPNIANSRLSYNAEAWGFWLGYLGPLALKGHLPNDHYAHFMLLNKIYKRCIQFSISHSEIDELENDCQEWVREYERLYYQDKHARLPVCTSPAHGMLHLASDARITGPNWLNSEWVMERMVQLSKRIVRNCPAHPFVHLSKKLKERAQLAMLSRRLKLHDKLNFASNASSNEGGSRRGPVRQKLSDYYSNYILCSPRLLRFNPDEKTEKMLMEYCVWVLSPPDDDDDLIPTTDELDGIKFERWGKVEIENGGDKIAGTIASIFRGRDASFVRYEMNADEDTGVTVLYGRVNYFIRAHVPAIPRLNMEAQEIILAMIERCETGGKDASKELVTYRKMYPAALADISAIQCVVGRVRMKDGTFGIIDRHLVDFWPTLDQDDDEGTEEQGEEEYTQQ